jgi:hypothetical protein
VAPKMLRVFESTCFRRSNQDMMRLQLCFLSVIHFCLSLEAKAESKS